MLKDPSLRNIIKQIDFLKDVDDNHIDKIIGELIEVSFEPNEFILKEGRQGGSFFFLMDGTVSIWHSEDESELTKIATIEAPSYFGELALLHEKNRNATIKTETAVSACMLCKEAFKELIMKNEKIKNDLSKYSKSRLQK